MASSSSAGCWFPGVSCPACGTIRAYLLKRAARIYPAFFVATLICVTIVATLGGATGEALPGRAMLGVIDAIFLHLPDSPGAFAGSHYPVVNGAMWTIPYEFRCYILVILLGVFGILRSGAALALLAAACLVGALVMPAAVGSFLDDRHLLPGLWVGDPVYALRLTGMFLAGAAFRAGQHRVPLRPGLVAFP